MTCTMKDLTNRTCKWPIGNPQHDDFKFCGENSGNDDTPYCEDHTGEAYRGSYTPKSQQQKPKKAA